MIRYSVFILAHVRQGLDKVDTTRNAIVLEMDAAGTELAVASHGLLRGEE
jgi:hypothetical protein